MQNTSIPMRLPLFETVGEAFRFIWGERRDFVALALLSVVGLSMLMTGLRLYAGGPLVVMREDGPETHSGYFLYFGVSIVLYVMFAVAWHRKRLLPEESVSVWTALRWDGRKTRFLLRSIGIGLLVALFAIGPGALLIVMAENSQSGNLVSLLWIFILIAAFLLFGRLSLWLPSAAVDGSGGLKEIWILGQGNSLRLATVMILAALPITFVQLLLAVILAEFLPQTGEAFGLTIGLLTSLLEHGVNYVGIAVGVAVLSGAYVRLGGEVGHGQ